jgi:hypothetical protein
MSLHSSLACIPELKSQGESVFIHPIVIMPLKGHRRVGERRWKKKLSDQSLLSEAFITSRELESLDLEDRLESI